MNDNPTRQNTEINIGEFTFSNAYCKFLKYSLSGTDASQIILDNPTKITYRTDYVEPRTLSFNLVVHAYGDGINGASKRRNFATTIKI